MGITTPLSLDCAEDLQRQYIKDIQQQVSINIAIVIISLLLKILRDVVIAASSEDQSDPHRPIPGSSLISAAIVMDSLLTKHWQHPNCLIYLIYFTYLPVCLSTFCPRRFSAAQKAQPPMPKHSLKILGVLTSSTAQRPVHKLSSIFLWVILRSILNPSQWFQQNPVPFTLQYASQQHTFMQIFYSHFLTQSHFFFPPNSL